MNYAVRSNLPIADGVALVVIRCRLVRIAIERTAQVKCVLLAFCMLIGGTAVASSIAIGDLKVAPLSPLGLRVDFSVMGTLPEHPENYSVRMEVSNVTTTVSCVCEGVIGDTRLSIGRHTVYWNASENGITLPRSADYVVKLKYSIPEYCVIDLSAGSYAAKFPITYMNSVPKGGWSDEYKTKKLVLKLVEKGSLCLSKSTLNIDKPYYMGVFEVTQRQWLNIRGASLVYDYGRGNTYPVYCVSYEMIRGSEKGLTWPGSDSVDAASFMGILRAKTGVEGFDLPTETQWEYCCRAGTSTTYSYGDNPNGDFMWYSQNSEESSHVVGTRKANSWGYYDMHGNVMEWCLGDNERGGGWRLRATYCSSAWRWKDFNIAPPRDCWGGNDRYRDYGFRLARTLP